MRPLLAALLVAACTATEPPAPRPSPPPVPAPVRTRPLALPGVAVDVPERWVALEPTRTETLRASAVAEGAAGSIVTIAAVRDPSGMISGTAYVQRSESPRDPIDAPETVRRSLEWIRDDLRARFVAEGMAIEHFSFAEKDDGIEGCVHARIDRGDQSAAVRACLRVVALSAERMLYVNVNCMARPADAEAVCGPIVASRRLDTVAGLGFDELLPANAVPLPGVSPRNLADPLVPPNTTP